MSKITHRSWPLLVLFILFVAQIASAQSCLQPLISALYALPTNCPTNAPNTICYGGGAVQATLLDGSLVGGIPFQPLDLTAAVDVSTEFGTTADQTGVALLTYPADSTLWGDQITLLAMGSTHTTLQSSSEAGTGLKLVFQSMPGSPAACTDQPPSLLLVRSSNATLLVNELPIWFSGVIALYRTPAEMLEIAVMPGGQIAIAGGSLMSGLLQQSSGVWSPVRALSSDEDAILGLAAAMLPPQPIPAVTQTPLLAVTVGCGSNCFEISATQPPIVTTSACTPGSPGCSSGLATPTPNTAPILPTRVLPVIVGAPLVTDFPLIVVPLTPQLLATAQPGSTGGGGGKGGSGG